MDPIKSIHELVGANLAELGEPIPSDIIHTLLMKERFFVGHKFTYDGGHAIWPAGSHAIEFYDKEGTLLKTAPMAPDSEVAA